MGIKGHPILKKSKPMVVTPKPRNVGKYYEFRSQNDHSSRELKKALCKLIGKVQIDKFLKRGQ